jgi:hypothetical protein
MRSMALQHGLKRRSRGREDLWDGVTLHTVLLWDVVVWLAIVELVWWLA